MAKYKKWTLYFCFVLLSIVDGGMDGRTGPKYRKASLLISEMREPKSKQLF